MYTLYLQAIVNAITQPLRIVEGMWTMQIQLKDTTTKTLLLCLVDDDTISKMIGWSAEEATRIQHSSDKGLKEDGANRLKVTFFPYLFSFFLFSLLRNK